MTENSFKIATNLSAAKLKSWSICWELLESLQGTRFLQLDDRVPEDCLWDDWEDFVGRVFFDALLHDAGRRVRVHRVVAVDAGATFERTLKMEFTKNADSSYPSNIGLLWRLSVQIIFDFSKWKGVTVIKLLLFHFQEIYQAQLRENLWDC